MNTIVENLQIDRPARVREAREPLGKSYVELEQYESVTGLGIEAWLIDPNGAPARIIRAGDDARIQVDWWMEGGLVKHLCGRFCVTLRLESIGTGKEITLRTGDLIDFDPCNPKYSYSFALKDAGLDSDDCGTVYKLAVTLTSQNQCGEPGHVAAFVDGSTVMVHPPAA